MEWIYLVIGIAVVGVLAIAGLVTTRARRPRRLPQETPTEAITPTPTVEAPTAPPAVEVEPEAPAEPVVEPGAPALEKPEKPASRLVRLRQRLAGSNALGRGLLGLLSREKLDEDTWEAIEDLLIGADIGVAPTQELVEKLRPLVPPGYTLPQLALRWCLDHPAVTTIIPGARNTTQAQANAAASDLPPLPAETHEKLRAFFLNDVKPAVRGPD